MHRTLAQDLAIQHITELRRQAEREQLARGDRPVRRQGTPRATTSFRVRFIDALEHLQGPAAGWSRHSS